MGKYTSVIQRATASKKPVGEKGLKGFAVGVGKGVLSTAQGLGMIGSKIASGLTGGKLQGADVYIKGTQSFEKAKEILKPQTTAEKIGKTVEQVGEFFLPAGKATKAEKYVDILASGLKSPMAKSVTKIIGKSAVQGLSAGGVSAIQTGGNLKQAGKTALGAGIIRGGFATIGEGARALRIPERLYSTLFKNTSDDMLQELRTEAFAGLQKTNPEKFNSFVKRGLIQVGEDGKIAINPTIAKQALDTGLRGSIRNMTKRVIEGTLESEAKVQDAVKGYKGTVNLKEPQFERVLREISKEYENVGFNEISDEAKLLADTIKNSKGSVNAEIALAVRRLLDRARVASSFDKPVSKLSLSQANLKTLADSVRSRVNALPRVGEIMKNYSFYIDALETLSKEAARRGNTQAVGLIDSLFLSGAFGSTSPIPGATAGILRKVLLSGKGTTGLGQAINNPNLGAIGSGTLGNVSSGLANLSQPQE